MPSFSGGSDCDTRAMWSHFCIKEVGEANTRSPTHGSGLLAGFKTTLSQTGKKGSDQRVLYQRYMYLFPRGAVDTFISVLMVMHSCPQTQDSSPSYYAGWKSWVVATDHHYALRLQKAQVAKQRIEKREQSKDVSVQRWWCRLQIWLYVNTCKASLFVNKMLLEVSHLY